MQKLSIGICAILVASTMPMLTMAHGTCAHESLHTYVSGNVGAFAINDESGNSVIDGPFGFGVSFVTDTETGDCDGDGIGFDFDGDLDVGTGGTFAFGHGVWAEHCGFHVETAGSVTVTDFAFGQTVGFVHGSNDANGFLFDPETGENTCITDGLISPGTDLEGDDCLSNGVVVATGPGGPAIIPLPGTQSILCWGGGDGLLWGFISGLNLLVTPGGVSVSNPVTLGTVTSP